MPGRRLEILRDPAVRQFIAAHDQDDVAALALKKPPRADWPYPIILDQIAARQKARRKMPLWLEQPDIILPPAALIEQASSPATAAYKASLFAGKTFCDLTAGTGIDALALARRFESGICVEKDPHHAACLAHNLKLLGANLHVENSSAEDFIERMPAVDLAMIDPQRRDTARKGKFRLEDGSPDILALLPALRAKAKTILLKTAPMLDIDAACAALGGAAAVHIIETGGVCREVLYRLGQDGSLHPPRTAVALDDAGQILHSLRFTREDEAAAHAACAAPQAFIYEPGPAFLKAGAFAMLAQRYDVQKLHPATHLYTSETYRPDFPGRHFRLQSVYPVDPKALPFSKAHLALRNFPGHADALRKRLKLADGGDDYLFACTLMPEKRVLLHVRKDKI